MENVGNGNIKKKVVAKIPDYSNFHPLVRMGDKLLPITFGYGVSRIEVLGFYPRSDHALMLRWRPLDNGRHRLRSSMCYVDKKGKGLFIRGDIRQKGSKTSTTILFKDLQLVTKLDEIEFRALRSSMGILYDEVIARVREYPKFISVS